MKNVLNSKGYVLIKQSEIKDKEEITYDEPQRFSDYFALLPSEHKLGSTEPLSLKKLRPFLLSSELNSNTQVNRKKGKGKGKKQKSVAKIFTASNPPPALNRFITENKPYRITQEGIITSFLTTSASIPTFSATSFSVAGLDQISNLTAIFDQYMIEQLEVWMIPLGLGTVNQVGVGGGTYCTVVDYDDANALTTYAQAEDYTNACTSPQSEAQYRRFVPHVAIAAYSGTFTSFSNTESCWIDSASTGVQHYGFKVAAQSSNVSAVYQLVIRYHLAWRNVR